MRGASPRHGRGRTCATTAGSSSSPRATTRRLPASSSSSTASTVRTPPGWRGISCPRTTRRSSASRCRRRRRRRTCSSTFPIRTAPATCRASSLKPTNPSTSRTEMLERRLYYHIDWAMIAGIFALCAIGLAQIFSATGGFTRIYYTQIYGILVGIFAMAICLTIDYRSMADKSHWIYLAVLVLLMYVLFFGVVRGGSRRWIDLGVVNLQPSEFAKATLALVLAKFFGESRRGAVTAVPLILVARQPDLGTAVTLIPVAFAIAYVAGMPMRILGILALVAVLVAPIAWKFALKDYQRERISTFLDPSQDAKGAGYQQIQ